MIATAEEVLDEIAKLHEDRHRLISCGPIFIDDLDVAALVDHGFIERSRVFHAGIWIEREKADKDETDKENDEEGENHEDKTLPDVLKQIDGALIPPEVHKTSSKPF